MSGCPYARHDEIPKLPVRCPVFLRNQTAPLMSKNHGFLQVHEIQVGGLLQNGHGDTTIRNNWEVIRPYLGVYRFRSKA